MIRAVLWETWRSRALFYRGPEGSSGWEKSKGEPREAERRPAHAEEQQEEQVKKERLDAQPALTSCPLKDHSLGKTILATASHSLSSVCLRLPKIIFSLRWSHLLSFPKDTKYIPMSHLPMYVTVTSKARLASLLSKMTLSLLSLYSQRFKRQFTKKRNWWIEYLTWAGMGEKCFT